MDNKIFTIQKGQSIWVELKATEDTDLIDCHKLVDLYWGEGSLDKLTAEQIIVKEEYFKNIQNEVTEQLTSLLLEKGFLNKDYLVNKYCNGGGL